MKKYIILIIGVLFLPEILTLAVYNDGGAYVYMGTLFFEGKLPYIHGWDHKGISLYLINGLGYLLGFKHLIGIRILEFILIITSTLSLYSSLEKKYSKYTSLIAVVFGIFSMKYFFDGGNLTEIYALTFIFFSLSFLLKEKVKSFHYILIGFFFIISFTIRANLIAFWGAYFFSIIYVFLKKKENFKNFFNKMFKMAIGVAIAILCLSIYFIATNTFSEFYNAAFTYNFSYSKQGFLQTIGSIITSTRRYEVSILMIFAFIISIVSLLKKRNTFLEVLLLFWIPLELYFSNMSGKLYAHYYIMWVPIIVLSTIIIINYLKNEILSKEKRVLTLLIVSYLCFQIPIFKTALGYSRIIKNNEHKSKSLSKYVLNNYKDSSMLVWGNNIALYNLTEKRATVPYFYQTFFKVNSDVTKEIIKDFTQKFINNPPDLLIDSRTKAVLLLDESNYSDVDLHQKESFKDFFSFVKENYTFKKNTLGVDFYERK